MPCFHPLHGYRGPSGRLVSARPRGLPPERLTVACGQCSGCRLDRRKQWAVRLVHELDDHQEACFVTLTYADDHQPMAGGLHLRHWQLFAKRLREHCMRPSRLPPDGPRARVGTSGKIRFFHAGEYGPRTSRPHYHAILYGIDFHQDRAFFKKTDRGDLLYTSPTLEDTWALGHCTLGDVTFHSAAYVAGYIQDKFTGPTSDIEHGFVDHLGEIFPRKPPYATMSRREAIGKNWFRKYGKEVYPDDFIVLNGKKFKPPRSYDNDLALTEPELFAQIKQTRIQRAEDHDYDNTPRRLATREKCLKAKLALFRKEL